MSARPDIPLDADHRRWCHDALQGTSRTFAITVSVLEEPMATQICVGYLLCRVADTVEDAGHIPPDRQVHLLETYRRALDPAEETTIEEFQNAVAPWLPTADTADHDDTDDTNIDDRDATTENAPREHADWRTMGWRADADGDDWRVVARAPRVVRAFEALDADAREALGGPVRELVGGMAMFVERHAETDGLRIGTIEELEEYCWYAAGTVGTLITNLLARDASPRRARRLAANDREFALLLQLVNVAKDVSDDYREENNVYLPATWLRARGVEPEGVCDPENAAAVSAVIRQVADRARGYVDDARTYLEATPETHGNTLAAWAVPYLLAVGTLRELDERAEDVLTEGDVKVSRAEVHAIVERFSEGVERSSLDTLCEQVARGEFRGPHASDG